MDPAAITIQQLAVLEDHGLEIDSMFQGGKMTAKALAGLGYLILSAADPAATWDDALKMTMGQVATAARQVVPPESQPLGTPEQLTSLPSSSISA